MDGLEKEALEYLVELGEGKVSLAEIDGLSYMLGDKAVLVRPPRAEGLQFATLQGFADFCGTLGGEKASMLIHVESPFTVVLKGGLDPSIRDRETHAVAAHKSDCGFRFGAAMDSESFVIAVQTLFEDSTNARPNDRAKILQIVGNMSNEQAISSSDDGVSQTVSLKAGVVLREKALIQNPFNLAPKRTFAEVEQPVAPFILRVHRNGDNQPPKPALYECDNEAWKIDAIGSIGEWLKGKITDIPILA